MHVCCQHQSFRSWLAIRRYAYTCISQITCFFQIGLSALQNWLCVQPRWAADNDGHLCEEGTGVCTVMVQVTVRHLDVVHCHLHVHKTLSLVPRCLKNWSLGMRLTRHLDGSPLSFIPSLPFVFLVSALTHPSLTYPSPTHPSPTHPSPTHPSLTYQGSGKLMFYDKELKQAHQLPVSDSVSSPRISICALFSYNDNVIDRWWWR